MKTTEFLPYKQLFKFNLKNVRMDRESKSLEKYNFLENFQIKAFLCIISRQRNVKKNNN
jgi:hypothetical protein